MMKDKTAKVVYTCCLTLVVYWNLNTYLSIGHIGDIIFNIVGILSVIETFVIGTVIVVIVGALNRIKEPKANLKIATVTYAGAIMIAIFIYVGILIVGSYKAENFLFLDLIEWMVLGTIVTALVILLRGRNIGYLGRIGLVYFGSFLMFLMEIYWDLVADNIPNISNITYYVLNYFIQGTIVLLVLLAYKVIRWRDRETD